VRAVPSRTNRGLGSLGLRVSAPARNGCCPQCVPSSAPPRCVSRAAIGTFHHRLIPSPRATLLHCSSVAVPKKPLLVEDARTTDAHAAEAAAAGAAACGRLWGVWEHTPLARATALGDAAVRSERWTQRLFRGWRVWSAKQPLRIAAAPRQPATSNGGYPWRRCTAGS